MYIGRVYKTDDASCSYPGAEFIADDFVVSPQLSGDMITAKNSLDGSFLLIKLAPGEYLYVEKMEED